jgi:chromosome segregation ATPase
MSVAKKKAPAPLVAIVTEFSDELDRFERLVGEVEEIDLKTEKAMRRAARTATDAAECEQRIAQLMAQFSQAIGDVRVRNENAQARLRAREALIVQHDAGLKTMTERFAAVGEKAREISQHIAAALAESGGAQVGSVALANLDAAIGALMTETRALVEDARAAGLADFARDVEALRQQLENAKKRLAKAADVN